MKMVFTLVIFFLCLSAFSQNQNKAGTLDSSFGVDGKVITNFGKGTSSEIKTAVVQSDDKIVEIGLYHSTSKYGFLAVRYTADGALDYTYGDSGKAIISVSGSVAYSGTIQKDNKVLITGYVYSVLPRNYAGVILRLNTKGLPDSSFGVNGSIINSNKGGIGYGSIAIQPDNKIVVTGGENDSSFINRFLENGTLDKTFGQNGFVYTPSYYSFLTCKIQADRKIVLAGYDHTIGFPKFCMQRYLPDGKIDKKFGDNGTVITDYGGDENQIHDIAFQTDGKIIATGETTTYASLETNFATARYTTDGHLDSTFGTNGKTTSVFPYSTSAANSIVVLKNDKIIIGGVQANKRSNFAMVKLISSGIPDSTFGYYGKVVTDMSYSSSLISLLLQTTGKVIAVGISGNNLVTNCALSRYNNTQKQIMITEIRHPINNNNIKISPNPATNTLHIEGLSSSSNTKLTVVDFAGNTALSVQLSAFSSSSYNLNIASLHHGNYLVKIETNGEVVTKQFLKE